MTIFTLLALLVAAIVVIGSLYLALVHIGLQEANDPTETRPEDMSKYERRHVHRADGR